MASSIMIGVFVILMETNTISDACTEQFFDVGVTNQRLVFKFVWNTGETKKVNCLHGTKQIGDCLDFLGITCPLDSTNTGAYTMSSNADLTEVYVTIVKFNRTTVGNYSCSKESGPTTVTICVIDSATTASTPSAGDCTFCWTAGSIYGVTILPLGVIELIVLLLIAYCVDKTPCWVFVIMVIISSCLILGGIILLANSQKGLNDGVNIFGMVVGSIGCAMLVLLSLPIIFGYICGCISFSKDPRTQGGNATYGASNFTTTTTSYPITQGGNATSGASNFTTTTTSSPKPQAEHIMLSYNRNSREMVLKIYNILKERGYKVWIDVYDMKGDTLDAMANAVYGSRIFIMCMSSGYQASENCRNEAKFAYQSKKKIIPLKMEKDFYPTDWLDLISGAKMFYDFSGKYRFEDKIGELLNEIEDMYK